jgi:glutathione S-transferase
LEEAYPDPALYPQAVADRARAYWYEDLGAGRVADLAASIFFQRFMRPFAFKQDSDEELVAKVIEKDLPPIQDYLEAEIPEAGYIFGEFMMADLSLVSPFINAGYAGYEVDSARWPALAGLISRVKEIPQVKSVLEKEARALNLG